MAKDRFGSVAASQDDTSEWLLWGAYRPLASENSEVAILSVCFHRYQPLSVSLVGGCFRPEGDVQQLVIPAA
jgi:hypothetical protein